jgi:TRAP-type transport system periplasmic protein
LVRRCKQRIQSAQIQRKAAVGSSRSINWEREMKALRTSPVILLLAALAVTLALAACGQAAPAAAPTAAPAPKTAAPTAAPAAAAPTAAPKTAAPTAAPKTAAPTAAAAVKRGEFVIKASGSMAPTEPGILAYEFFKKNVEERTNGRIEVQIFPTNQLGNERDVIEGLTLGTVQMANPSNAPITAWVPAMNIFELPFIWQNRAHMAKVLDGPIGAKFAPALKEKGIHLLGYEEAGLRHVMTTKKAVNSMADMAGLKIRTMENPVHLEAFRAFGANPLPMAYGELYTALQQGVIDGAEAANTNYNAMKFYEPAPNWAMIGWLHLVSPLVMSERFYQSLPADLQQIVSEEGKKTAVHERELYAKLDEEALDKLKAAGVKITTPDRAEFMKASEKVYDAWADRVGGRALIDEIVAAGKS